MIEIKLGRYEERELERAVEVIANKIEMGDYKDLAFDIVVESTQHVEIKDGVMTITGKVVGNGHEFEPTKLVISDHEFGYEDALNSLILTKAVYDFEIEGLLKEEG